jgi:membrane associated rhomboid family serine protease
VGSCVTLLKFEDQYVQAPAHWNATPFQPVVARPWTTYLLMFSILAVMCVEIMILRRGMDLAGFLQSFGIVSADFSWSNPQSWVTLLTYNFLHSGGRHFAGNAIIMVIAGIAVEKYLGRQMTLLIWIAGGIAGGLAHLLIFPDTTRALVGASGAISALLGAALIVGWQWALPVKAWPGTRVLFKIRLPVVTGIWLAGQFYNILKLHNSGLASHSVASWVHLASFAFGAAVVGGIILYKAANARPQPLLQATVSSGD